MVNLEAHSHQGSIPSTVESLCSRTYEDPARTGGENSDARLENRP